MKLSQLAAAAVVFLAGSATQPAFAANDPNVIWRGDFDDGAGSLGGHCSTGDNGWCNAQVIRPDQIQLVTDPAFQGHGLAARLEVKFGDVYKNTSDERTLLSPPNSMWEDEGNERWYRWQAMWPDGWVGDYPKWDELMTPSSRSSAGSIVEWHHDGNGQVETGSAPLYIGANNTNIWMCLVDQATSTCRESLNLTPLLRGHWHDFVMHAKWSSDPNVGFLEMWIDGVNVLPMHRGPNKYPNMRNYLLVGLYRNVHIGDPTLVYPNGTRVYPSNDGTPGVAYIDGFIAGYTRESVEPPATATQPPPSDSSGSGSTGPSNGSPATAASAFGGGGGCASSGAQTAWLALPAFALFALRRRRRSMV
jgi:MYXO-CTERM domain-containing protein